MGSKPDEFGLRAIHGERLVGRDIDQLLGICEFALLDGYLDAGEAERIYAWLQSHRACIDTWPANVLYDRLSAAFSDGRLDPEEERDLLGLILSVANPLKDGGNVPASLPLDVPAPEIVFAGRSFCFTGVFDFGTRNMCQQAIVGRGGVAMDSVTKKLHYLVIGNVGADTWKHSSFGNKIAKAIEVQAKGVGLSIISEGHWRASLGE